MLDVEVASLLDDAGFRFDPLSRQYIALEDDTCSAELVADLLEIPLDDLVRWEQQQQLRGAEEVD